MSEYEQLREDNIKRNKDFFQTLFGETPTTNAAVVTPNETTFTNETRTTINIDPVEVLLIYLLRKHTKRRQTYFLILFS